MSLSVVHIIGDTPSVYTVVLDVTSRLAGKRLLFDSAGNTWELVGPNSVSQCGGDLYGTTDFRTIWVTDEQVVAYPVTSMVGI